MANTPIKDRIKAFKNVPEEVLTEVSDDEFARVIDEAQRGEGNEIPEEEEAQEEETGLEDEIIDNVSKKEEIDLSEFIDPEDAAALTDTLMSVGASLTAKAMKLEHDEKDVEATPKNMKTLEKVWGRVLKHYKIIKLNPLVLLLIAIIVIYGSKIGKIYVTNKLLKDAEDKGYERAKKEMAEEKKNQRPAANKKSAPRKRKPAKKSETSEETA